MTGFNDILKCQVEKTFRDKSAHSYPYESPLVYRAPLVSEDSNFDRSTALFQVSMYRQFARKVGTGANSALIRYYLPRLKLSSSTRVSEGANA